MVNSHVETISYSGALQGEPLRGFAHFAWHEAVSRKLPLQRDISVRCFEELNQVLDAGDVLSLLRQTGVDLVLAGHRHVPYVWPVAGMLLVHSGTVSTLPLPVT